MAVKRDYYEVLGVDRRASTDDLKRAFRKIALENHPDRNPGNPEAERRFKEAGEAYEVLSDPEKRRSYDMFGHAGVSGAGQGPGFGGFGFEGFGFSDIFESFFGGAARTRTRSTRGSDLRYDLTISFEEAFTGVEREITVPRLVACERCHGEGAEPGTGFKTCSNCAGSGQIRRAANSIFGQVVNVTACPSCGGEGRILESPCAECRGQGRKEETKHLVVPVPAGVDTGSQIRLSGQGEAGYRGGGPGDLYIVLKVKPHPQFTRRDQDIFFELPVNIVQAALGDAVEVPTLEGPVQVTIPPGTQYGQSFRLRGKGMPHPRSQRRGDQLVVVRVVVPKDLKPVQREALSKVGGLTGKPEKLSRGFFEKLRDAINLD